MFNENIDVRHLMHLLKVAESSSMQEAARQCGLTQPALSHSIKTLEQSLAYPLFRRSKNGLLPTVSGRQFLKRSREFVDLFESELGCLRSCQRSECGQLIVAIDSDKYMPLLQDAFTECQETMPTAHVSVVDCQPGEGFRLLQSKKIDVLVTSNPAPPGWNEAFSHEEIGERSLWVVDRCGETLAAFDDAPELLDLCGYPLLALKDELSDELLHQLRKNCSGDSLSVVSRVASVAVLHNYVQAGLGIGILAGCHKPRVGEESLKRLRMKEGACEQTETRKTSIYWRGENENKPLLSLKTALCNSLTACDLQGGFVSEPVAM
jgi:DNA-binding transcriptional LysR family regulator